MDERAVHQDAQSSSCTENKLMLTSSRSVQNPFDESVVLNSGVEAKEAQSFTAETNYYQRLLMGNAKSNAISSKNSSSQEPNFSVQASRKPLDSTTWNSYQKLLSANSITPSTSMTMKPSHSWYEAAPPSTRESITQLTSSTGTLSTISFTQGDQDPRKYVLNKLLMEKVFSSGGSQGPQPPTTPQFPLTGGGSQKKSVTKRAPGKGPRSSSTRAQSSSMINKGNSPSTFKGPIKAEEDMLEGSDMPLLPGVKVKKEVFYR